MAFYNTTTLVQRTLVRLRQVPGVATQTYSETLIVQLLEEVYEHCRALRWWDHLMDWTEHQLNGTTGIITDSITGLRDRMRDIRGVYTHNNPRPLPVLDNQAILSRFTGTTPRAIEALPLYADNAGGKAFRVYPLTSTTTVDTPIRVLARKDTAGIFTTPTVLVPFDATALINGACMKYSMGDATNPGATMEFDRAFNERIDTLLKQHDSAVIPLDSRSANAMWPMDWFEVRG